MTRARTWTLGARIIALCVATALVLVVIALAAAGVAMGNRSTTDRLLNRGTPLVLNTQILLTALVNQETGIRGYALNGHAADLDPYTQGRADEQTSVASLLSLLTDRPDLAAQVRTIESRAEDWRNGTAVPVIAAVRDGDLPGAQALMTDASRGQFEVIRAEITSLQGAINDLREQMVRDVHTGNSELVELLIAAGLVIVISGLGLIVLLRYLVVAPVAELAGEVRRVAAGDFEHSIGTEGPPELVRLASDVEGMRRKIVADLHEVRAARQLVEETNRQLEVQAEELTRSNRDLEQFAYVASHDLQEPLRKVASFCQLLQRRYAGQLDDRADQYIGFAVDGAQRMQRLINDLLAFSRIGRLTSGFTDVDLNTVVRDAVEQRETDLTAAGGAVTWSELPTVRGEEPLLTALIGNLISNSVKFRRPDAPPRLEISARQVDDEWEITCQDNGIGIDPEFAEKVFVIFQRLHAKEIYSGTGIGLAIAKKIVEYHGGRIWLDTTTPEGTTIRFTLPMDRPAPTEPAVTPDTNERVEETIP
jgi:signal transduction histidine kinase